MKKLLLFIFWLIFWLTLESTVLSGFPTMNIRLEMALLAVIATGFTCEFREGLFFVLAAGIFCDAFSYAPFGIVTASYVAAFTLIRFAASTIYVHSAVSRFVWTFIVSAFSLWTKAVLIALVLRETAPLYFALWNFLPQALLNGTLGIFIIPLFNWYIELSWNKIFRAKGIVLK